MHVTVNSTLHHYICRCDQPATFTFFIPLQHHCRSQTSFQATKVSHCALTFVWDVTGTICWKMRIIYTCTYSVALVSKSADEKWKSAGDQNRKSETACENKITKK